MISRTKIQIPQLTQDHLPRVRLVNETSEAVQNHTLTLISAPAGAGKTTLAASVVQTITSHNNQHAFAWLRLDVGDNDPQTFLAAAVLALQSISIDFGQSTTQYVLENPDLDLRPAMTLLINDIHDFGGSLSIVFDDYHAISNPHVHEAVDYFLDQLPAGVHLVLTSRYDPPLALVRLRMRGQLAEIRLPQLHFDQQETKSYLEDRLGLDLSVEQLSHLQDRTEGWIAGLRLLALTLKNIADPADRDVFISEFSRSNRLVFDLLAEEVLAQQPSDVQAFLLETAVLDELTPKLCTAVTKNGRAPKLLAEAYRRNLFLTATDPYLSADSAYRYHDLFADLLRRKLKERDEAIYRTIHQRAALAHPDPVKAIDHALLAHEWPTAVEKIVEQAMPQLHRRHISHQTADWVSRLPEEVRTANPWIRLITTFRQAQAGDIGDKVIASLKEIRRAFQKAKESHGEYLALVALSHATGGYDLETLEEVHQLIDENPEFIQPDDRMTHLISTAWAAEYRMNWEMVNDSIRQMLIMLEEKPELHYSLSQGFGLQFLFSDVGMPPIERFVEKMVAIHGDGEQLVHVGIYNQLSAIRFYQARLEEALAISRRSRNVIKNLGNLAWQTSTPDHVELHTHLARGDYLSLHRFLDDRLPDVAQNASLAMFLPGMYYMRGIAFWHEQRFDELAGIAEKFPLVMSGTGYPAERRGYPLLQGWLAMAEKRFPAAAKLMQEALMLHEQIRHTAVSTHPRLDLACLYWLWYQETGERTRLTRAEEHLEKVLGEAAERRMPGILLQSGRVAIPLLRQALKDNQHAALIKKALAAFGEETPRRPLPIPDSDETLTPREVEVLYMLMAGASNRQIAEELVITTRTAKAHVSNILQKMKVSSRAQAAARARKLSLL